MGIAAQQCLSPVSAFAVAGRLSLSFFTAVTPIPYSVPGFNPTQKQNKNIQICMVNITFLRFLPVIVAVVVSPGPCGNSSSPCAAPEIGLYFTR